MVNSIATVSGLTVGIDLGDKYSNTCVLDAEGEVIERGRIRTTQVAFGQRFGGLTPCRIVIEVGTHSPWVSRVLAGCGHEVLVANPRKFRLIYRNEAKDDETDAELLARVGRMDPKLLNVVEHREEDMQAHLAVLRARNELVGLRTAAVNHVRGAVKSFGARLPGCSTRIFHKRVGEAIPPALRHGLEPLLNVVEFLNHKIQQLDREIERLAVDVYPETGVLRQVAGVGPLTALGYVLTLESPDKVKDDRAAGSYVGLVPKRQDSGERSPQLRITKTGDSFVRRLLVGSAHYILGPFGPDSDLRRWGMTLAGRGGKNGKKRAIVAVARKLAVLLHRLWRTGEEYIPLIEEARRAARSPSA